MTDLKLNDPVTVEQKSPQQPLQGIVSYLGSVEFAEGDDWVGVRLTGASVGRGKNDGSVQGKAYFQCTADGGVFVRASHVHKRTLSKLEELRLKRELQGGGSVASSASSRRLATSVRISGSGDDDDSSVSSARSSATGASNRSRLDEIRQRRLDLQGAQRKNKLQSPPPKNLVGTKIKSISTPAKATSTPLKTPAKEPSSRTPARSSVKKTLTPLEVKETPLKSKQTLPSPRKPPSPSSSNESSVDIQDLQAKVQILTDQLVSKDNEVKEKGQTLTELLQTKENSESALKGKVQTLATQLDEKENDNKNLQNKLRESEQVAHDAKLAAEESKAETLEVRRHADEAIANAKSAKTEVPSEPGIAEGEVLKFKEELAELRATNEILEREKMALDDNLSTTQRRNSSMRHVLERERESHAETMQSLRKEISEARSQASYLGFRPPLFTIR